jgi:hypothetical protein
MEAFAGDGNAGAKEERRVSEAELSASEERRARGLTYCEFMFSRPCSSYTAEKQLTSSGSTPLDG